MGAGVSVAAGQGFSTAERVRTRAEIQQVFETGTRYSSKGMRIHVKPNALSVSRAVFVPVRAYPSAVARNRARRLLRECWRLGKASIRQGYDVAVVLYPGFDSFAERGSQLRRLLRQAGLMAVQ